MLQEIVVLHASGVCLNILGRIYHPSRPCSGMGDRNNHILVIEASLQSVYIFSEMRMKRNFNPTGGFR